MNASAIRAYFSHLPQPGRAVAYTAVFGALLALIVLLMKIWTVAWGGWLEIAATGPRIARLKGYELAGEQIEEARALAALAMEQFAFVSGPDNDQVGATLQQALRQYAEEADLTVRGSRLVTVSDDQTAPEDFDMLMVQLDMIGDPQGLTTFLSDVYQHTPFLKVLKLNMVPATRRQSRERVSEGGPARDAQILSIDIHVVALMVEI